MGIYVAGNDATVESQTKSKAGGAVRHRPLRKKVALSLRVANVWESLVLLFTPSSAATSARLLAIRTRRNSTRGISRRRCCTRRNDPQIDSQFRHAASVDNHDPAGIDATRIDEVVLGAICSRLTLCIATAVANDVALRRRVVLQLDRKVIQSGLFIIEPDVAVGIELRRQDRLSNVGRARGGPCAVWINAAKFHSGCD